MEWDQFTERKPAAQHIVAGYDEFLGDKHEQVVPVLFGNMPTSIIRVPYGSDIFSPNVVAHRIAQMIAEKIKPTAADIYVELGLNYQEAYISGSGLVTTRNLGLVADIISATEDILIRKAKLRDENEDHAIINIVYLMPLPEHWSLGDRTPLNMVSANVETLMVMRSSKTMNLQDVPYQDDFGMSNTCNFDSLFKTLNEAS